VWCVTAHAVTLIVNFVVCVFVARDPEDPHFLHGGRCGWVVCRTMNQSPSTDLQYRDFNRVFLYKTSTCATSTRYLRGRY
jgi:hypothetical protein